MLKDDNGKLCVVAERPRRYPLAEMKEELLIAMGLVDEDESAVEEFMRTGFMRTTWFEAENAPEDSDAWRM